MAELLLESSSLAYLTDAGLSRLRWIPYLTDVVVVPAYQRCGIGSRIVAALTRFVDTFPYRNTVVGILPTPGLRHFYERHGYKAQPPESPALSKWVNRSQA